jgi:hypothetical protein
VSDNRHRQRWTPADTDGRSVPGQARCSAGSRRQYLASGRRGREFKSPHPDQLRGHTTITRAVLAGAGGRDDDGMMSPRPLGSDRHVLVGQLMGTSLPGSAAPSWLAVGTIRLWPNRGTHQRRASCACPQVGCFGAAASGARYLTGPARLSRSICSGGPRLPSRGNRDGSDGLTSGCPPIGPKYFPY